MERERLTRLLEDPGRATREDAAALRAMAEQYPWFTGAQLLRAVGERAQGNVLADEALRIAAAHLPSRAVLHDLVERAAAPAPLRVVKPEPPSEAPAPPPPAPLDWQAPPEKTMAPASAPGEPAEPLPTAGGEQLAEEPLPIVDGAPQQPPSGSAAALPAVPEATETEAGPIHREAPPEETPAPLADGSAKPVPGTAPQPLAEPADDPSRMDKQATTPPAAAAPEADELDRQITQAALASAVDLTLLEELSARPVAAQPSAAPEPAAAATEARRIAPGARLRFSEWLDAATDGPRAPAGPSPAASTAPPPAPAVEPVPAGQQPPAPIPASDLIDRFIRQQPPEIPPKPAFFTPQQAAKKSLDDTAGLVTETLARIYVQQGNVQKAIDAYRRLALKYPEKSSYFAALSKELEENQTP